MEIKNIQVNDIYIRWKAVWESEENSLESRLKAYSILEIIESLVHIYEHDETLDKEDIDDLFIGWNKDFKPLLPEERPEILSMVREQLKKYK